MTDALLVDEQTFTGGYAPVALRSVDQSNLEHTELLTRYGYELFKETERAQYWKSSIGTTVTLCAGGWTHSGSDTVKGSTTRAMCDRLLKYHHKLVPKE